MIDTSPAAVWSAALGQLQVAVNKPNFDTWLRDTTALRFDGETLVVGAQNDFTTEWLSVRMRNVITQALARVAGGRIDVAFEVLRPEPGTEPPLLDASSPVHFDPEVAGGVFGRPGGKGSPCPSLTFESFVVGEENRLAWESARNVVSAPGQQSPLVIFGANGLGKTHLLHAAANAARASGLTVVVVTGERFSNDFVHALGNNGFDRFRRRYREADVLLVDDAQFLEGKEKFQEEFFHTFNELHAAGRQIIVTCDRVPGDLGGLSHALRSRLAWGLQVDLAKPGFTTRLAILRAKAARLVPRLPDTILEQIAERCCPSVRELEGYLNRVIAHLPLLGGDPTPDLVERALAVFTRTGGHDMPTDAIPAADDVIVAVCRRTGASRSDLSGRSRSRDVSYARHLAMYLLRLDAQKAVVEIQRLFGNRDHSTVLGAIDRIENERGTRPETAADIAAIRDELATSIVRPSERAV
jgi:chromosomal replication initiator protein